MAFLCRTWSLQKATWGLYSFLTSDHLQNRTQYTVMFCYIIDQVVSLRDQYWCCLIYWSFISTMGLSTPSTSVRMTSSLMVQQSQVQCLAPSLQQKGRAQPCQNGPRHTAGHEPAMCSCSPENQLYPRLFQKKCGQQVKGSDPAPLLYTGETSTGVLYLNVESSVRETNGHVKACPEEAQ